MCLKGAIVFGLRLTVEALRASKGAKGYEASLGLQKRALFSALLRSVKKPIAPERSSKKGESPGCGQSRFAPLAAGPADPQTGPPGQGYSISLQGYEGYRLRLRQGLALQG